MSESSQVQPQLVVLSGAHKGDVIVLDDRLPVVFGSRVGIHLPEPALDPVHCQVLWAGERWLLQDFGSPKGTWLGDDRVEGLRPLEFGRSFRIGATHVALHLPEAPGPAESKQARPLDETQVFDLETPPAEDALLSLPLGSAEVDDLLPQDSLGDYDVLALLGEGTLGKVFKGFDRQRRRVVAVKVLDPELAQEPKVVARFLRGAKAGSRLNHRHMVKVLAAGHASGRIYVTMELVDGLNLEQFCVASGGTLRPRVALGIVNRIVDALVYAHARGVLHRNVSPSNILVGRGGFPKLSDLALAKRTSGKDALKITAKGQVLVTSPYAPPGSLLGGAMDARSDVYGVGATLFRALTGIPPYGDDPRRISARILAAEQEELPQVSEVLRGVLDRCLQPDHTKRFAKMSALREALADVPELE